MKKKILWLGVSFLLVAALALASCGPAIEVGEQEEEEEVVVPGQQEEEEEEEEEEVVVPVVGEPQYGGTFTLVHHISGTTWMSWDPQDCSYAGYTFSQAWQQRPLIGDIEKYGPRGTGDFSFQQSQQVPEKYLKGELVESWEIDTVSDPIKITFHVRPGIYWAADHVDFMGSRELVAEDIVYSILAYKAGPLGGACAPISAMYATDRYTYVVEMAFPYSWWAGPLGHWRPSGIYPHEVVEAPGGTAKWQNQVGTGPFILTEYVEDSHVTSVKNPNYWEKTIIDGKEYDIPFIDKFVQPIIVDESTRLAALRTGKVDMHMSVSLLYETSLDQTSPDLVKYKYLEAGCSLLALQNTSTYFSNRDIRRAMMIGTDLKAIRDAIWIDGEIHGFPLNSNTPGIYTPIEELPESTKLLFDYKPDLAKKMLADAGYPDGFDIELVIGPSPQDHDIGSMLVAMWDKIGVSTTLIAVDGAHATKIRTSHVYKDAFLWGTGTGPSPVMCHAGQYWYGPEQDDRDMYNCAEYNNPDYDEKYWRCQATMDWRKMEVLAKELCITLTDDAPYIAFANPNVLLYHWPWIMNYWGETDTGMRNYLPMVNRLWIDPDLKAEMGY